MTTISPGVALVLALAAAGHDVVRAQDPLAATAPPARLLQIDAVAVDRDGNPVTDLTPGELEVWIGGYRVPIERLVAVTPATEEGGRLTVLLLDDITLDPTMVARSREVARRFVTRMRPGDRMGIAMLNGGPIEITSDPSRLLRRIDAHKQALGAIGIDQVGQQMLEAVAAVGRSIVEAPDQRKTIVAIGSAWLLDTPVPPAQIGRNLRQEWFDALRALAVAHATYYVIDPQGVGASRVATSIGFAREAGGHAFVNTNDLDGAVDRVLREASHYYLIGVGDPPVGRKTALRDLDVRVLRRGVTVRARRSIPGGGS